jgi:Raf kinase inhibitor-like YbhB/YbcL family protein
MLKATALALFAAFCGAEAAAAQTMTLTSPDIAPGAKIADEQVFNAFGCTGANISPALAWSGAPQGAKSFALSVYDPDAPTGSGFWHWVVFNIPPGVTSLPKNAGNLKAGAVLKGAVQSRTDFGVPGYGGPCPPQGDPPHHYHFTIFAVDTPKLDGDENTTAAVVGFMLHFHTLAKAELVGVYGR